MQIEPFFEHFAAESLTYDDLICLPDYVDFALEEVELLTWLTRGIRLKIPVVSAPMDTVTEAELAIALALQGGIGLIHYNMSPERQLQEVRKVKRFKSGAVFEPIALPPTAKIRQALAIRRQYGYSILPITHDGSSHGKLLGMLTKYDYSAFSESDLDRTVHERMVPIEQLAVGSAQELSLQGSVDVSRANERLLDSHAAALPVVDREGHLCYLFTRSDLEKHQNYPNASVDASKSLLVGAAVETWAEKAQDRIERIGEDVDVIVFDTAQGFCSFELDLIRWTKRRFPELQVIAGNVVTPQACTALIDAGADAIRVGMGSGSICTTQEVGGVGRGQATAVYTCGRVCRAAQIPLIADGGITKSSDIVKALSLGASCVMMGSMLACTTEAPGQTQIKDGIRLKEYRGMGSLKAMEEGSSVRYGAQHTSVRVPEGVSGFVPSRGSVSEWVFCLMQAVKQGMHKLGSCSLVHLHDKVARNQILLERRSEGAKREGSVHSLFEIGFDRFVSTPKERREGIPKEMAKHAHV